MEYRVKIKPGSSREKVVVEGGEIVIWTHARAHDGEANRAVVELLSKHFRTAKSNIAIVAGERSREKRIRIQIQTS